MDINSVGNTFISTATQATEPAPQATEVRKNGQDRDGDADNRGSVNAVKPETGPTTNTKGQTIGQVISTKA